MFILVLISILPVINSGADEKCQSVLSAVSCETKYLDEVPSDLPSSITSLNLKDNFIKELTSDSFKNYRFLKDLNLEENNLISISSDAFSELNYLTKLNLRFNSHLENLTNLPASLELLDLRRCTSLFKENNSVNFSNLKSLKHLNLQDAELTKFPKLADVGGSLKILDIRYNKKLTKIDVADLAPLCKLENLYVSIFNMKSHPCDCQAVLQWIRQYDIKGSNITCGENEKTVICENLINLKEFENTRRYCYMTWTWKTFWIYGAGFLLSLLFIICCFFLCRKMKCNQISISDEDT